MSATLTDAPVVIRVRNLAQLGRLDECELPPLTYDVTIIDTPTPIRVGEIVEILFAMEMYARYLVMGIDRGTLECVLFEEAPWNVQSAKG